ncbi:4-hydroxythreonine-4-phosphate dehydrogenase PdxA [Flavobacteriaceae bacterium Ap0902]|nr:4-hydroxythreonine-4-phosphate dehydrogenase PdxA [Flavobacteriaceae bacterium Ap0902]
MNSDSKPIIAISIGDPNGIGLEIILKALDRKDIQSEATYVVFCPWKLWIFCKKHFKLNVSARQINNLNEIHLDKVNVIDSIGIDFFVTFGEDTKDAGNVAFHSLESAAQSVLDNQCDILVTAPINKANIQSTSFQFPGHTEYLEKVWGGNNLMFMVHEQIKVGLVTQHIPLKEVSFKITADKIIDKFKLIHKSLEIDFNLKNPVIGVLGVNPHAGDQGLLGDEEITTVIPAIKELINSGYLAYGPHPADSFFSSNNLSKYDGVLAMYHDQGLIPFKTIAGVEGVNYTAGLPFVRTSPDHGVGYDIAGKNVADAQSFIEAIYTGIKIYKHRMLEQALTENALKGKRK